MFASLGALVSHQNRNPYSKLEEIGDRLISPLSTLLGHRKFVVLNSRTDNSQVVYTQPLIPKMCMNAKEVKREKLKLQKKKIIAAVLLPLALIGALFKLVSLVISKQTREVYLNWKKNHVRYDDFYADLKKVVCERKVACQFLQEIIDHTDQYFLRYICLGAYNATLFPPFSECACKNFDRLSNKRRVSIEKKMLTHAQTTFPPSKVQEFNYVSLGSGKMLQEIINVGNLIRQGYQNLNVTIIEPEIFEKHHLSGSPSEEEILYDDFCSLMKSAAKEKNINITIEAFPSVAEYSSDSPHNKAHLVSAVDFEEFDYAVEDVLKLIKMLDDKGRLYLSYHHLDHVFGPEGSLDYTSQAGNYLSTLYKKIIEDLENRTETKKNLENSCLKVAVFDNPHINMIDSFIREVLRIGYKKIELTCICKGDSQSFQVLQDYIAVSFPSLKDAITVNVYQSIEEFKKDQEINPKEIDIVKYCTTHSFYSDQIAFEVFAENFKWIAKTFHQVKGYFDVPSYLEFSWDLESGVTPISNIHKDSIPEIAKLFDAGETVVAELQ